jgi:hypothetical protein
MTQSRDDIIALLMGFRKNFHEWEKFKDSIEREFDRNDPNRPNTEPWDRQLSWAAQWRQSLENQLKHLRRMVAPYAKDTKDCEHWSIKDLFEIMGETYVTETNGAGSSDSVSAASAE